MIQQNYLSNNLHHITFHIHVVNKLINRFTVYEISIYNWSEDAYLSYLVTQIFD